MHLDFANALNLVSTVTLIGALIFTGLQVRAANRARREQAAVTVIQMAALSENSTRILELLGQVPENASGSAATNFGRSTMTASSQNQKANVTARSTNASSSTEST